MPNTPLNKSDIKRLGLIAIGNSTEAFLARCILKLNKKVSNGTSTTK